MTQDEDRDALSPMNSEELELEKKIGEQLSAGRLDVLAMPVVVVRILRLLQSRDVEISKVAEEVGRDQGVAAHVLALANSAFYRGASAVSSVHQAVVRLGLRELKGAVLMISLRNVFNSKTHPRLARQLWRHSLATALTAKRISQLQGDLSDEVFTAGLVHDIGKIVVLALYERLVTEDAALEISEGALAHMMDEFHVEAGRILARDWDLPSMAAEAIITHHADIVEGLHSREGRTVALANRLAGIMGFTSPGGVESGDDIREVCRKLGIDSATQQTLISETPAMIAELEAITAT